MKILLTLLATLFALTVQAQTTFEHFTAVEDEWPVFGEYPNVAPNVIWPGEFSCTGGGEEVGQFECDDGNGIHIRDTQMVSCMTEPLNHDWRLEGTVWFDFAANWDSDYSGPVSGNWRIVPVPGGCDFPILDSLYDPYTYWEGTYTGKRELVPDPNLPFLPRWITTLKLRGFGMGDLTGQKIKATEVITTYGSAIPVPYEMLPPEVQFLIGTGPEGLAEITIITTY
jgi:hypothetical protein